jgi:hypothetical protein
MMKMKKTLLSACMIAGLTTASGTALALSAVVEQTFFPYKSETPDTGDLKPGMTINSSNLNVAEAYLDEGMLRMVKDGWVELNIGALTPLPVDQKYVDATDANLGTAKLGEKVGEISGYISGRPFPEEPSLDDPRAGEKLAWNFRYGTHFGDSGKIGPFYWTYKDMNSGKVEKTLKVEFNAYNWKHRTINDPIPEVENNPADLFRTIYLRVDEPFDVKNTQLLIHRYENDLKRDNAWLYLGFQRRVRRLATGQTTDAFLGSDLMIEDFEGYNGRISDQTWEFKGVKWMLVPVYDKDKAQLTEQYKMDDGYQFTDFGGKGGCFPNITWQVRKNYLIEVKPIDPNHPVGHRDMFLDAQTFAFTRINIYDRADKLWKMWFIGQGRPEHTPHQKDQTLPIYDSFGMMDIQAMHCTTGQFRTEIHPEEVDTKRFTPQYLRAVGR